MSLGKLPVLSWVSGSHGKRRLKSELTPDMISPPLGDFRHTMHVGRGGDVFGDTSFLSNHGGDGAAKPNGFFARTLRHHPTKPTWGPCTVTLGFGGVHTDTGLPFRGQPLQWKHDLCYPVTLSPCRCKVGFLLSSCPPLTSCPFCITGLESGFCTIPRVPRSEKAQESALPGEEELKQSDSLLSFRLDLGPSLMSELLQVMSFSETNGGE
ncbi:Cdc42 effector protein 1, partial [Dryobates pubescens]